MIENALEEAASKGLILMGLNQISYMRSTERRTDAWEARFYDDHGHIFKGAGKTAFQALTAALNFGAPVEPAVEDII